MQAKLKIIATLLLALGLFYACDPEPSVSPDSSTGKGGSMARFVCQGDHLYVLDGESLSTYDVSDSTQLLLKSRFQVGSNMETLFPTDSLLFMGSTSGMYIYSLKNPAVPGFVSSYWHLTSCDPVVVQGKYAFVTLRTDGNVLSCSRDVNELQVIDISDIRNPVEKISYTMINPRGLAIDGNTLFVCDGMSLVVMNAKDPLNMTKLKDFELDGTPYDLIARDGLLTVTYSAGIKQYAYDGDTIRQLSTLY